MKTFEAGLGSRVCLLLSLIAMPCSTVTGAAASSHSSKAEKDAELRALFLKVRQKPSANSSAKGSKTTEPTSNRKKPTKATSSQKVNQPPAKTATKPASKVVATRTKPKSTQAAKVAAPVAEVKVKASEAAPPVEPVRPEFVGPPAPLFRAAPATPTTPAVPRVEGLLPSRSAILAAAKASTEEKSKPFPWLAITQAPLSTTPSVTVPPPPVVRALEVEATPVALHQFLRSVPASELLEVPVEPFGMADEAHGSILASKDNAAGAQGGEISKTALHASVKGMVAAGLPPKPALPSASRMALAAAKQKSQTTSTEEEPSKAKIKALATQVGNVTAASFTPATSQPRVAIEATPSFPAVPAKQEMKKPLASAKSSDLRVAGIISKLTLPENGFTLAAKTMRREGATASASNKVLLTGACQIISSQMELSADQISLFVTSSGQGLAFAEATGHVKITLRGRSITATAERVVFDPTTGEITLREWPKVTQGTITQTAAAETTEMVLSTQGNLRIIGLSEAKSMNEVRR